MTRGEILQDVWVVYNGSDGDRTRELYRRLEALGPLGFVAMNLFRAAKCSQRAKDYRGGNSRGSYRAQAYERKEWSIAQLCDALAKDAGGLVWGWQHDPKTAGFEWVVLIETPKGQVSYHGRARGAGPDHPTGWDGVKGQQSSRIVSWCADLLSNERAAA